MDGEKHKELSLDVKVQVLPTNGLRIKLEPTSEQLKLMVKVADIVSIERFVAELEFRRWQKKGVSVKGKVFAQITQQCVITLEPVSSEVNEEIDRIFVPPGSKYLKPTFDDDGELVLDYDGRDEPELYEGTTLDAWEIAMEHFTLGIDPFPRAEGAELEELGLAEEVETEDEKISPFAALKDLYKPK